MTDTLLDQIERDALDPQTPVATALRKCVILGGRSGSEALRDWATRELDGYHGVDDLPDYRRIPAAIQLDAMTVGAQITGQSVPPSSLPDVVRDRVKEEVELREGIAQVEHIAQQPRIQLALPGGADLVRLMNAEINDPYQRIDRIYWQVAPVMVRGAVDQVRNALVKLVAEIRANTPAGQDVPSDEAATQAINFIVSGKRAKVAFNAAQASGAATATATTAAPPEPEAGFWTTSRRIGAVIVGIATIAGAVFAAIQVF